MMLLLTGLGGWSLSKSVVGERQRDWMRKGIELACVGEALFARRRGVGLLGAN